ncbi:NACHT, LRR and PYD domains-containing protein 3-like isoform X2 [Hoplias malabaricus]|uniref:NACHT, LRR and PYD domains-containing protein 3-like isoform X2 n=1 Tax=Hoplias malabaricus TaxID=27720 RepID=UPI003461B3E9
MDYLQWISSFFSSGRGTSDQTLQTERPASPDSRYVSMKSDVSLPDPPTFSKERDFSHVSMKSDVSLPEPPSFSKERDFSHVSMKSDVSLPEPPAFSKERDFSHVSMKSDVSLPEPPSFSKERDFSHVSMKSDVSLPDPPTFSKERDFSHVSMKSGVSLPEPPSFSKERDFSHVSMKSDVSLPEPPTFSKERDFSHVSMKSGVSLPEPPSFSKERDFSHVSMKSDVSLPEPPSFSKERDFSHVSMKSDVSLPEPPSFSKERDFSHVSMKSDVSLPEPPSFSKERDFSHVSMKSDVSLPEPPTFSKERDFSHVSMKSDVSLPDPPTFSKERDPSRVSMKSGVSLPDPPTFNKERDFSRVSMKSGWSVPDPPAFSSGAGRPDPEWRKDDHLQGQSRCGLGLHLLTDPLSRVSERHRTILKNRYESLFEGIRTPENKTLLNTVYTQLYIIEGESEGVNEEHEVLQMEKTPRRHQQDAPIHCSDIFKPLQGPDGGVKAEDLRLRHRKEDKGAEEQEIRRVLTKGIAGIGKTVSVQKFILDWAEGAANQEVDLMFVLPFRELNLIKDDQYSLHGLLCAFHPELRDLDPEIYDQLRAVFIFDGLDESRLPLAFEQCEKVSDITVTSSVGVLMTNLIRGDLLLSALIWITSRPAAANQIPPRFIHRVTEIQGFTDPQKEEYFRKRIRDQDQAQKIISHIKTARSLHIMCHIPVFCWISATVLQRIITQSHTEIPTTLTEMYSHFLLTLTNTKKEKYEEKEERDPQKLLESNRTELLKLAELAFTQLLKGNVMFYEEDLRESSIDVTEASVYSGIFTEIFREECVIHQRKVYCFVHLSFQEFLAAVFVFHCYENNITEPLQCFIPRDREESKEVPLDDLLKGAVNKAVKSQNGRLDLFLRFLLGLSLESNQSLLQGLMTHTHRRPEGITECIKELIKRDHKIAISTERSINLFLCLSEMKDKSLYREIEEFLNSEKHSKRYLSLGQCSALTYILLTSEEELEELDLGNYDTTEEGYRRLIPAVAVCRKAQLSGYDLTKDSCEALGTALQSENSLKELDLSNNDLQDSGVELLSAGLKSPLCKLETLRLSGCRLGDKSCESLGSVLQSNSSLKELDLSNNDLQDSGVELLSAALKSPLCKLETLRLALCGLRDKSCKSLGSALQSENSLKELDLSNNDLQDSGVELLSAALKSSLCKLETLRLSGCMITDEGCSSLASALKSNPSHLRKLDLSYNNPGESGVKLLSDLLQEPYCALETLQVEHQGKIRMKPELRKYACDLTLKPNTAHPALSVSEGNRKVEWVEKTWPYSDHPERFEQYCKVHFVKPLTGRCYWEVEWRWGGVYISVSQTKTRRKGHGPAGTFVLNEFSWCLMCSRHRYWVRHNKQITEIPPPPSDSDRVGVYLDCESGTLSFYAISTDTHTLTHLHTFTSTFTEPLYAEIGVDVPGSSVRLCEIE